MIKLDREWLLQEREKTWQDFIDGELPKRIAVILLSENRKWLEVVEKRDKSEQSPKENESMGSMKEKAMAEVAEEQARAERYQEGYADGYREGFGDGYDRALQDIRKLKSVAAEEMLRGFKGKVI